MHLHAPQEDEQRTACFAADSGIQEVVVVDLCAPAIKQVISRNAHGGRKGLHCIVGDPADEKGLHLHQSDVLFDLAVDKVNIRDPRESPTCQPLSCNRPSASFLYSASGHNGHHAHC